MIKEIKMIDNFSDSKKGIKIQLSRLAHNDSVYMISRIPWNELAKYGIKVDIRIRKLSDVLKIVRSDEDRYSNFIEDLKAHHIALVRIIYAT